MFTKYTIALAALLLVGGSSLAGAYEDPENKIGDRYPMLEQGHRPVMSNVTAYRSGAQTNQGVEDPEYKIGDRYPFLDASTQSATANRIVLQRTVAQSAIRNQDIEDPEAKIADRYPFLEQTPSFVKVRAVMMAKTIRPAKAVVASRKSSNSSY
jgi:hypothetical protein